MATLQCSVLRKSISLFPLSQHFIFCSDLLWTGVNKSHYGPLLLEFLKNVLQLPHFMRKYYINVVNSEIHQLATGIERKKNSPNQTLVWQTRAPKTSQTFIPINIQNTHTLTTIDDWLIGWLMSVCLSVVDFVALNPTFQRWNELRMQTLSST